MVMSLPISWSGAWMAACARSLCLALCLALTPLTVAGAEATALDEEIDLAMDAFDEQPFEASLSWSSLDLEDDPLDRATDGRQPFEQEPPAAQSDFRSPLLPPQLVPQQQQVPCNPQIQICP
ncbi:MAG: hypothetical protein AAF909_13780 [Pseudomonadota bacterium]